jgi:hypothetical protein
LNIEHWQFLHTVIDRRYSLLGNDTGNRIAPVGEAGCIRERTNLNGIGCSRREAGDRRGWTRPGDQLRGPRSERAINGRRVTNFVRASAENGYQDDVKLTTVLALRDLTNELRQLPAGSDGVPLPTF